MMTLEECSQFFIASRTFDGGDMIANVAGIAAGEAVVRLAARRWRRSPAQ
jgi:glycopeptide antibiotics resistance protein